MAKSINVFLALLCCAFLRGHVTAASAPALAVLYPPDRSVVVGAGFFHLVLEIAPSVRISVKLNGRPVDPSKLTDKVHHYLLRLDFGINRVEVEALAGDGVVAREKRELFFFSPISGEQQILPEGFAANPFHRASGAPEKCAACHVLEPQKGDLSPASPAASSQTRPDPRVEGAAPATSCGRPTTSVPPSTRQASEPADAKSSRYDSSQASGRE